MSEQMKRLQGLIEYLLCEMPEYKGQAAQFADSYGERFRLFRSLVNVRPPMRASAEFLALQDKFLTEAAASKGITDIAELAAPQQDLYLWQGDITALKCDAVVNAANSGMTGCYCPCHGCVDNVIHTFAGVQLRAECAELIKKQGSEEAVGQAKITEAYNLPCKHIIHTVGPVVGDFLTQRDERSLACCYASCLRLADERRLESIAFCCISTGEFHFPNRRAAQIAIKTVNDYKTVTGSRIKVIFDVFKDKDYEIYRELLGAD